MNIVFIPTFKKGHPKQLSRKVIPNKCQHITKFLFLGASSGIGAGTAIHFAKNGAKVSITGRNEENLKKIAQKCEEASPKKEKVSNLILDSLFRTKSKKGGSGSCEKYLSESRYLLCISK